VIELTVALERTPVVEEANALSAKTATPEMSRVLSTCGEQLSSSGVVGGPESAAVVPTPIIATGGLRPIAISRDTGWGHAARSTGLLTLTGGFLQ
jgi:hypothetical protein